jgi:hypothetical protein
MLYKPRPTGRSVFWGAHQDTFVSASKSVNGQKPIVWQTVD